MSSKVDRVIEQLEYESDVSNGTVGVQSLLKALDAIGEYAIGYGEGAARVAQVAAELIRQLGTDVDGSGPALDLTNAEVHWPI